MLKPGELTFTQGMMVVTFFVRHSYAPGQRAGNRPAKTLLAMLSCSWCVEYAMVSIISESQPKCMTTMMPG